MQKEKIKQLIENNIAGQDGMNPYNQALVDVLNALTEATDNTGDVIYVPFIHGEDGEVYDIPEEGERILKQARLDGKLLNVVLREELGGQEYTLPVIGYRINTNSFDIFFVELYQDEKRVNTINISESK